VLVITGSWNDTLDTHAEMGATEVDHLLYRSVASRRIATHRRIMRDDMRGQIYEPYSNSLEQ
jgi:hypothetical protein